MSRPSALLLGGIAGRFVVFGVFGGGGVSSGRGDGVAGRVNVTFGGGGFIFVGERGGTVPNLFWLVLGSGSCVGLLSRSPLERD